MEHFSAALTAIGGMVITLWYKTTSPFVVFSAASRSEDAVGAPRKIERSG